jgi:putative ABC transport system permease protein
VAIVSERFARSFAGRIGPDKTVAINGTPQVIVGVLPQAFHFALLQDVDILVPLVADDQRRASRVQRSINVIGRLQDHTQLTGARAEISAVMSQLASEHPDALAGRTVLAVPLRDALLGNMKPILTSLLVAVALLLVTMGANLALLMLARYVERAPELAMRSALGATRARVLRQLLVESLVPSLAGAALATVIGQLATRSLLAAIPEGVRIGMPYLTTAGLDGRVIGVIVGVATMLAIGFGLGPALVTTTAWGRVGSARTTLARGDRRLRRGLVAAQVALTVVLLVSSGLLVVSFWNLVHRDLGFRNPAGLVTARVPLSGQRYSAPIAQQQFYETLLARGAALPGVRDAGVVEEVPGGGSRITTYEPVDRPRSPSIQPRAALRIVGGAYFSTMGIPVVAGRGFASSDRTDTPPVAVVSASFAKLLGMEGATLGRRLRLAATGQTVWEVVGVVGDVQIAALDADSPPVIYLSHLQLAENRMTLVLRTETGVASVAGQVRAIVKSLDPGVPVSSVTTLHRQLGESTAVFSRRLPMILCGVFAAAALALTLVALYAICMHEVLTRRREFGIRIALGGSSGSIRQLILHDAMLVGAAGIGIGAIVAMLVSRSMHAVLFGVSATDWRVYGVVAAVVLASGFLATLGPALRAGSVSPSVAMRAE